MKPLVKANRTLVGLLIAVAYLWFGSAMGQAGQVSLDHRIFEAFEKIDGRTAAHEESVIEMRARLDKLAVDLGKLRTRLSRFTDEPTSRDSMAQKRALHGEMINLSAEYLSQAYKLVDSAAAVISANLSDLAKLSTDVRKADGPGGGAKKIQKRVRENILAGRSMRRALVELRNWARQDPSLVGRFESLSRLTASIDRRISVDKVRLAARRVGATGTIRSKHLDALDQTVDRLGDMYAEVIAEKDAIKDLRDEVAVAIQIGRLEMTQEVAERAIPNLSRTKHPSSGIRSLQDMASTIGELNDSLIAVANKSATSGAGPSPISEQGPLVIREFSNF